MVDQQGENMNINKAMVESYLRNLFGVALALITSAMATAGVASPFELGTGEWLTVLNGVWAAAVPTLIRWLNKKDPAFGRVAEVVAEQVSEKITAASKTTKKKTTTPRKATGTGGGGGVAKKTR